MSETVRLLVGAERVALCGALGPISPHAHATAAVVVGLDRPIRFVAGAARECRAALLAPGFTHAVDVRGSRLAVFLLPPRRPEHRSPLTELAPGPWLEIAGAVDKGCLLDFDPIDHALRERAHPIDDRLHAVLDRMRGRLDENVAVAELAAAVRLSPTRLMALARAELGTSLRTYRRWLRTFEVARDYAAGATLTEAAHRAGFASSAHLSAAAREHFGIRPSQVLRPASRAGIVALR
ncbi:MAG: helix-turn-helix domain-containing protein [Labilithrix sp.]|nr:helix-turn-helix domain-containing protein [Labilithrix sp.]